jgi:hypothetical protein
MFRRILTLKIVLVILISIAGPLLAVNNTSIIIPPGALNVTHYQTGDNNFAMTITTLPPNGNIAVIGQAGFANYAEQYQSGIGNETYIFQEGINNFAGTTIVGGDNNITTQVQSGTGNLSSIAITGGNNINIINYQQGPGSNYAHVTTPSGLNVTTNQASFIW